MELNIRKTGLGQTVLRTEPNTRKKAGAHETHGVKKDAIEWSRQAIEYMRQSQQEAMEQLQKKREEEILLRDKEAKEKSLDALEKMLRAQDLCMKIAARIMRGDKVPPEDEKFLMENDPNGYKLAMACRKPKKHPKEWKSLLKDEDRQSKSETTDGSGESVSDTETTASTESDAAENKI